VDLFFLSLAGLITVVGPWKAGVVFAERAMSLPTADRRRTAVYTVLISVVVGLVFIVAGDPLLDFFHISDAAFLIGAGLLVIVFSIGRVLSDEPESHLDLDSGDVDPLGLAIYPLSIPMVITPPGIASLIALGVVAELSDDDLVAVIGAFLLVMLLNLVVFLIESQYGDRLNPALYQVAGRVLGVLLVAFGVKVALDGVRELGLLPT
jgi:multiple antibiotic resistance protein